MYSKHLDHYTDQCILLCCGILLRYHIESLIMGFHHFVLESVHSTVTTWDGVYCQLGSDPVTKFCLTGWSLGITGPARALNEAHTEMEIEAPKMHWRSNTCGKHTKIRSRIGLQGAGKLVQLQKWRNMKLEKSIIYPELSTKTSCFVSVTHVWSRFLNNWQNSLPLPWIKNP